MGSISWLNCFYFCLALRLYEYQQYHNSKGNSGTKSNNLNMFLLNASPRMNTITAYVIATAGTFKFKPVKVVKRYPTAKIILPEMNQYPYRESFLLIF